MPHTFCRVLSGAIAALILAAAPLAAQTPARLQLQPNDRVIFIGNTMAERLREFNNFETRLVAQYPEIIAFFGLNESYAGEAGLPQFEKDLDAYLAAHQARQYNGRSAPRIALVSPMAQERLARLDSYVDLAARNRVPQTADVLFSTPLVNKDVIARLRVTAPMDPGDYPYLCTFPAHWRVMNGVMVVAR